MIASKILHIYAHYNKRLEAYILQRDYGIHISVARVYRLFNSTQKPFHSHKHNENGEFTYHLQKDFNQKAPNIVWVSDFTYIKAVGKWYYFCIVMYLFSRKIILWNISGKPAVNLIITAFKKAYTKRNAPLALMFHSDNDSQYTSISFRRLLDNCNVIQILFKKSLSL